MNKTLHLPFKITVDRDADQPVVTIALERGAIAELCLGLLLLSEALADTVLVLEVRTGKKLRLKVARSTKRTRAISGDDDHTELALVPNDLDYLLHSLLKCYRDGAAEVDHFDLQANFGGDAENDAYVTFELPDFAAPVTAEEAKRRLGIS